jgi:malate dehydrogenase (oxaloacetate-decarboxylating)
MNPPPTDGYSITLRLALANKPGVLGLLTSTIGAVGGSIGAIDIVEAGFDQVVRDITVAAGNDRVLPSSRCPIASSSCTSAARSR